MKQEHKDQIRGMTNAELNSFRNILEFNLSGFCIGDPKELREKLKEVKKELDLRSCESKNII